MFTIIVPTKYAVFRKLKITYIFMPVVTAIKESWNLPYCNVLTVMRKDIALLAVGRRIRRFQPSQAGMVRAGLVYSMTIESRFQTAVR